MSSRVSVRLQVFENQELPEAPVPEEGESPSLLLLHAVDKGPVRAARVRWNLPPCLMNQIII